MIITASVIFRTVHPCFLQFLQKMQKNNEDKALVRKLHNPKPWRRDSAGGLSRPHRDQRLQTVTDNAHDLQLAALNNLGLMYAQGLGVEQDYAQALQCYQQAADQGAAQAQSNLAVMYSHAQGVAQDFQAARKWYQAAAEQGLPSAQSSLATLYANGQGGEADYAQALHWYQAAAAQGDGAAQVNLG